MIISEITSIQQNYFVGGSEALDVVSPSEYELLIKNNQIKKLPGNNRYTYQFVGPIPEDDLLNTINIYDPKRKHFNTVIAQLKLAVINLNFIKNATQVASITVHEDYTNQNLAKALYGLALLPNPYGLNLTIVSGFEQTPGGQQMWNSLAKISNVEITGFIRFRKRTIEDDLDRLDYLFGKIGGVYMGESEQYVYYEVPVELNRSTGTLDISPINSFIQMYVPDQFYNRLPSTTALLARYSS